MLSKAYRLSDSASIRKLIKEGETFNSKFFRIKWFQADSFKATVVVANKISKSAVKRNSIKRKLRGLIEEMFKNKPAIWMVVFPLKNVDYDELSFNALKDEMKRFYIDIK